MHVVHAVLEDARSVAEIHVSSWQTAYKDLLPADYLASLSAEQREKWWRECISAGTPQLLVAKDNDSIVGWINFGKSRDDDAPESRAEIWALYAAPTSFSTGIGRMLWLCALEQLTMQGFTSCSLWVIAENSRAIRFYRKAGFVRDDRGPAKSFDLGGVQLQEVRYVRAIDNQRRVRKSALS